MTLTAAIGIALIAAVIVGLMMWRISAASEARVRHLVSTALNRPDHGHTAALIRSRALDAEYRDLVANAQGDR